MRGKLIALFVLLWSVQGGAEEIRIWPTAVEFAPFKTPQLELRSITKLESFDDRFGGLSGLLKDAEGFISVTDKGNIIRFKSADFTSARLMPLHNREGNVLKGKKKTDAEGLAVQAGGGLFVSFERKHRIVPYDLSARPMAKKIKLPDHLEKLSKNAGFEAIETLSDGRLVLIAEGHNGAAQTLLFIQGTKKDQWRQFGLPLSDGFRPTGLARLPDSDTLVLLERFYQPLKGVRIRLSLLDGENAERGKLLAEIGPPIPVDNFEGIAAYRNKAGETIIALVSDDNFSPLQRTLVMKLVFRQ